MFLKYTASSLLSKDLVPLFSTYKLVSVITQADRVGLITTCSVNVMLLAVGFSWLQSTFIKLAGSKISPLPPDLKEP